MRFTDVRRVAARPAEVWEALHDPAVLGAFPGCERLIPLDDAEYAAIVSAEVDRWADTYRGLLRLADRQPGSELRIVLTGRGRCGTLEVDVCLRLEQGSSPETTLVRYDARTWVGGLTPASSATTRAAGAQLATNIADGLERALQVRHGPDPRVRINQDGASRRAAAAW